MVLGVQWLDASTLMGMGQLGKGLSFFGAI